jgi:hypothetical protein
MWLFIFGLIFLVATACSTSAVTSIIANGK